MGGIAQASTINFSLDGGTGIVARTPFMAVMPMAVS